jgi:hypothetical protein
VGQVTVEEIRDARDAMVRARIWHLYRDPTTGFEYVEYEGYDAEQTPSYLAKRAARPTYPDPPDRPDLKAADRLHYQGKGKPAEASTTTTHGSADLPAETKPGVPSPAVAQGAVPGHGGAEQTEAQVAPQEPIFPDGFSEIVKCHEQHSTRFATTDDRAQLLAVMKDAALAGVEWQTLLTIMREAQAAFKRSKPNQVIKFMGYYVRPWNEHIQAAKSEREKPARGEPVRPEEIEDPRDRIRRERAAAEQGMTYATAT